MQQPLLNLVRRTDAALQLHVLVAALEVFDGLAERIARQRNQIIHQTDLQIAGQQSRSATG